MSSKTLEITGMYELSTELSTYVDKCPHLWITFEKSVKNYDKIMAENHTPLLFVYHIKRGCNSQ